MFVRLTITLFFGILSTLGGTSENVFASELRQLPAETASYESYAGGTGTTALANLLTTSFSQYANHSLEYVLKDGTRIGGFLFQNTHEGRPLIICNFGVLTDRWSSTVSAFIKHIILENRIDASFLIVDSVSSASFAAENGGVSLGGYDEGRILNELADTLSRENVPHSSLILMGVSLGGLAVLEALIEDARLHTHHFAAGISFSGVVNESGVTDSVLNTYGYRMRGSDGSKISGLASLLLDVPIFHFNDTRVHAGDSVTTKLTSDNAGQIFYQEFSKRLQNLAKNPSVMRTWNHAVKLTSVEEYIKTSSELVETSADKITVPVILIHAKNDPLVPYADFAAFAEREKNNSFIQTHATLIGGHWGYFSVFGVDWVTAMLKKLPGVE